MDADTNPDAIREAFARLPERITAEEVAAATGRTAHAVRVHWHPAPGYPAGTHDRDGQVRRERDAVLAWYLEQHTGSTEQPTQHTTG
ncbi:hypothetical protein [Streptomyces sp. NPDC015125]|uniref:hypothetical protein n=1 Tax=Streptomyces sp. NPDC015125 TaxID=3364938 RepID=UPI0036FC46A2